MGLFSKKDPAAEYEAHKKAYKDKFAVSRIKREDLSLEIRKCVQSEQIVKILVFVRSGCFKIGDLLEIPYEFNNKLGVRNVTGQTLRIYQIHGSGRQEELVAASEAYPQDLVWIDVPGIDAKLIDKRGFIVESKAKNVAAESIKESPVSVSYDEEVSKMVNYFKSELYGYFMDRSALGHVTQDLSYALMAQRKRLDRMGIAMAIEKSSDIGSASMKMEVSRYSSSQYDVAEANEPVKLRRSYYKSGRCVYQDDDWRICHYLLAGAKYNNSGDISCPNCGHYAKREELLNGCPYCNTQFTIQDLSLRVAGYAQKQIMQSQYDKIRGKLDVGYALYHESNEREYDQILRHRMEKVDPLFSPTAFYNSMRNKLFAIVFAESPAALQNLADEDFQTAPFFDRFKDVIDIDIQRIDTKNCKPNDQYVLVDVVMTVMVLRFDEYSETAKWSKESITMSFVKHISNKTKNIFEPSKIQCSCCGASYSLYEGKACSYCGHEIDYLMYDWLLIDLAVEGC